MTIQNEELQSFHALERSDLDTNGGRMSANVIPSGVPQNVFAHVFKAERTIGSTKYRKIFDKVSNDADETLFAAGYYLFEPTSGEDYCVFWPGTQRDTQAEAKVYAGQIYGSGWLDTDVNAGGSVIIVDVGHVDFVSMFADLMAVMISDKPTADSGTGNQEEHVINGVPSVNGTLVTITLVGTLANNYTTLSNTKISGIYKPGDVKASFDNWVLTSAAGTYDQVTYPPILDNIGTVDETNTITFDDATNFTAVGDSRGTLGSGTIGADFIPINGDWSKPLFKLEPAGFGGTFVAGDTIVGESHPAAVPLWEKRVVPEGAAAMANNKIIKVTTGETA